MKVLISSKSLAKELAKIDFSKENIMMAELRRENQSHKLLVLYGSEGSTIEHNIESEEKEWQSFDQGNVRWDWIRDDLSKIEDQPIILNVLDKRIDIIIQY